MTIRKGDQIRLVKGYQAGATGVVVAFRTNRFYGRQATVQLDANPEAYQDWTLTEVEKVTS